RPAPWPCARRGPSSSSDDGPQRVAGPGLEVSLRQLLQRGFLQLSISQQPFEPIILLLKLFESFGVLGLEPAVLVLPPVVGGLVVSDFASDDGDIVAFG